MTKNKTQVTRQIWFDHENIKIVLEKLRKQLTPFAQNTSFAEWKMDYLHHIFEFKQQLQKHFTLEEEGGFTNNINPITPEDLQIAKRLESEHDQIMELIKFITNELNQIKKPSVKKLESIKKWVDNLIQRIERHENAEDQLLRKAYPDEYGKIEQLQ
mgnify:CR=1 FL=1